LAGASKSIPTGPILIQINRRDDDPTLLDGRCRLPDEAP